MNISSVFITQCYFQVPKYVRLYCTHFLMKSLYKQELKQTASNHLSNLTLKTLCSVESCVNKTIIWLYVCVSESLFNVSIVSRLIYTNCVIDSILYALRAVFAQIQSRF